MAESGQDGQLVSSDTGLVCGSGDWDVGFGVACRVERFLVGEVDGDGLAEPRSPLVALWASLRISVKSGLPVLISGGTNGRLLICAPSLTLFDSFISAGSSSCGMSVDRVRLAAEASLSNLVRTVCGLACRAMARIRHFCRPIRT